jgi:hypothetical protein
MTSQDDDDSSTHSDASGNSQSNNSGNNQSNNSGNSQSNNSGNNQSNNSGNNQSNNSANNHSDASGNNHSDASGNSQTFTTSIDLSYNVTVSIDNSFNIYYDDPSCNDIVIPPPVNIVTDLSSSVINGIGYTITTNTGKDASGSDITNIIFDADGPDIYEDLTQTISIYDNQTDPSGQTVLLLNQIRSYANEIQCSDFHGKGSIDDYTQLFQAAAKIASETKQMDLNIDIEGFTEFSKAADDLSELFNGFIIKLQNVNIINDTKFLQSIATALGKIVNLSNTFGEFKETVLATSKIQIPKSSHDASIIINGVMDEVNCAMQYIGYFVDPSSNPSLSGAALSAQERNVINKSVETVNSWNILCEQGISIAMSNDIDIQNIQSASSQLKIKTNNLKAVTSSLKSKLASYNILC